MSGRTPRNKAPTTKGKVYYESRVSAKAKSLLRSKNKSDMDDLIRGMESATDLGRPSEGAMAETAMGMEKSLPVGPVIQPATFVPPPAADETMDSLTAAMGKTAMGGKYRRKQTRRRRKHRRRTHRH